MNELLQKNKEKWLFFSQQLQGLSGKELSTMTKIDTIANGLYDARIIIQPMIGNMGVGPALIYPHLDTDEQRAENFISELKHQISCGKTSEEDYDTLISSFYSNC